MLRSTLDASKSKQEKSPKNEPQVQDTSITNKRNLAQDEDDQELESNTNIQRPSILSTSRYRRTAKRSRKTEPEIEILKVETEEEFKHVLLSSQLSPRSTKTTTFRGVDEDEAGLSDNGSFKTISATCTSSRYPSPPPATLPSSPIIKSRRRSDPKLSLTEDEGSSLANSSSICTQKSVGIDAGVKISVNKASSQDILSRIRTLSSSSPPSRLFPPVLIKPLVGKDVFTLSTLSPTVTVASLKDQIYWITGIPIERQTLCYNGQNSTVIDLSTSNVSNRMLKDLLPEASNRKVIRLTLGMRIASGLDTPTHRDIYDVALNRIANDERLNESLEQLEYVDENSPNDKKETLVPILKNSLKKKESKLALLSMALDKSLQLKEEQDDISIKLVTNAIPLQCSWCKQKCRIALQFRCRSCNMIFCAAHRYPEEHRCGDKK